MGNRKWTDDYFSKRLRAEREQRGWSQADMAKRLSAKDIPMHWTTIAKIEAGDRSVRIVEAVGMADLFEVSLDALLGRSADPRNDERYAAHALHDAVVQAAWQVEAIETTVRDRLAELAAFPGPKAFTMGFPAAAEAACDRLTDAADALHDALNLPAAKPFQRLLRKMLIAQLQKEEQADDNTQS